MADRLRDWVIDGSKLQMCEYVAGDESGKIFAEYDLEKLYKDFKSFNDVQQFIIIYGVKQKLADAGSSCKGDVKGMVESANEKWNMFLEGKLSGTRANASGVKEAKKVASKVKELATVVSLEGLTMKKVLEGGLSEEDQKKLDEFMQMKVNHLMKELHKKK